MKICFCPHCGESLVLKWSRRKHYWYATCSGCHTRVAYRRGQRHYVRVRHE